MNPNPIDANPNLVDNLMIPSIAYSDSNSDREWEVSKWVSEWVSECTVWVFHPLLHSAQIIS